MSVIQEDGTITLPSNRVFSVTGNTRSELEREMRGYYTPGSPANTLVLSVTNPPIYSVHGEVYWPGLQLLLSPTTVLTAVESTGGFTDRADKERVQLLRQGTVHIINCAKAEEDPAADRQLLSGDKIVVPRSSWK